jgi:serine/threonine protein kinase
MPNTISHQEINIKPKLSFLNDIGTKKLKKVTHLPIEINNTEDKEKLNFQDIERSQTWLNFLTELPNYTSVINIEHIAIQSQLGRGKFASVYSAKLTQQNVKSDIALKVAQFKGNDISAINNIPHNKVDHPPVSCTNEFFREIVALSSLARPEEHRNIITIVGCTLSPFAIAMELLHGENLFNFLEKSNLALVFYFIFTVIFFLLYDLCIV